MVFQKQSFATRGVTLELNPAPELGMLESVLEETYTKQINLSKPLGFWGTVGAVALGVGLADFFFEEKD